MKVLCLPFIVLLAVPVALLGAIGSQALRGLQNDVYCQIGLVMLIGLSSKNAILIVEFAEQLRAQGMSIVDAAVEAARIRLRPILMTSLAFILGVLPLVLATGRWTRGPYLRRHHGVRRNDRRHNVEPGFYSGALRNREEHRARACHREGHHAGTRHRLVAEEFSSYLVAALEKYCSSPLFTSPTAR